MGRRKRNNNKRKQRAQVTRRSTISFPLTYLVTIHGNYSTKISTLYETFDRRRPFRISSFRFEASADAKPFMMQFQAFGPVSSADNVWTSDIMLVSQLMRRGSYVIPATVTSWYPSDAATSTEVFRLVVTCEDKNRATSGLVLVYLNVTMGPREDDGTCPAVLVTVDVPLSS